MPRPEKVQAVEEIRRRLSEAKATFVTEYRGLTVAEQQSLRAELRKADGDYKVVKMSLARLAADAEGLEALHDVLAGPTALAFAATDAVTVAKALRDFAKEHERLIVKAGVLAGEVLAPEKVAQLADIEPRDVLLGRIAGGFQAPLVKLAGLLQALPRNAASMFSLLLEKKEAELTVNAEDEAPPAREPEPAAEPDAEVEPEPEAEAPALEEEPAVDVEVAADESEVEVASDESEVEVAADESEVEAASETSDDASASETPAEATADAEEIPESAEETSAEEAIEPEPKAPAPKKKSTPKPKAKPKATDTKETDTKEE
jgi:large subunit ribosomal protein L10